MVRALNPAPSLLGALCAVVALSLPVLAEASRHGVGGGQPSKSQAGPSTPSSAGSPAPNQRHARTIPTPQAQRIANAALETKRAGKQKVAIDKNAGAGAPSGQGTSAARSGPRRVQFKLPSKQFDNNAVLTTTRKGSERAVVSSRTGNPPASSKKQYRGKDGKKKTLSVQTSGQGTSAAGQRGRAVAGNFAPVKAPAPSKKSRARKTGKTDTFSVQSDGTPSVFLERAPLSGSKE